MTRQRALGWMLGLATTGARAEGRFILSGETGFHQKPVFSLVRCQEKGAQGPARFSCSGAPFERALNVESSIEAGFYRIEYSGTFSFLKIEEGKLLRLKLGTLGSDGKECLLNRALNGGSNYRVLRDLSERIEQNKELEARWSDPRNELSVEGLCKLGDPNARSLCESWNSGDPQRLRWTLGVAGTDVVYMDELGRFGDLRRRYASEEIPCGEKYAVLLGSYAIENVERGEIRTGYRVSERGENHFERVPHSLEVFQESYSQLRPLDPKPIPSTTSTPAPAASPQPTATIPALP